MSTDDHDEQQFKGDAVTNSGVGGVPRSAGEIRIRFTKDEITSPKYAVELDVNQRLLGGDAHAPMFMRGRLLISAETFLSCDGLTKR